MSGQISKKRKFVADGVFKAELNDFLACELSEEGYSGCDVRVTHARTEVCDTSLETYYRGVTSPLRSSSVPPTPRRFSVRRVAAFVSLLPSCRSVSSSPKTPSSSMPRRSSTVDFLPSLSARV